MACRKAATTICLLAVMTAIACSATTDSTTTSSPLQMVPLRASVQRQGSITVFVANQTFNIMDHGAKGDGKTNDTTAVQSALEAASKAGGGIVWFPAGHTFVCAAIEITSSNTALQIDGTYLVPDDRDKWPGTVDIITARNQHDLALIGTGQVNGQGLVWWQHRDDFRPRMVSFSGVKNVLVDSLTFVDSPNHNLEMFSDNTELCNVTILAPPSTGPVKNPSHNTDAVDVHGDPFFVHDCMFSVGDDNIAAHANNTLVSHCHFGDGHGASIGSVGNSWLRNITFDTITFDGTTTGMRIKTITNTTGAVKDVVYKNLVMKNVGQSVEINMFYDQGPGGAATMDISDISFINITSDKAGSPGSFLCDPHAPCHQIQLKDFVHTNTKGKFECQNAYGTTSGKVSPSSCLKQPSRHQ